MRCRLHRPELSTVSVGRLLVPQAPVLIDAQRVILPRVQRAGEVRLVHQLGVWASFPRLVVSNHGQRLVPTVVVCTEPRSGWLTKRSRCRHSTGHASSHCTCKGGEMGVRMAAVDGRTHPAGRWRGNESIELPRGAAWAVGAPPPAGRRRGTNPSSNPDDARARQAAPAGRAGTARTCIRIHSTVRMPPARKDANDAVGTKPLSQGPLSLSPGPSCAALSLARR